MTVCNASVIIPLVARMVSTSETFHDSDETATSGKSNQKKHTRAIMLSTVRNSDPHGAAVRIDVNVDQENGGSKWGHKVHDVESESIEVSPDSKKNEAHFVPL